MKSQVSSSSTVGPNAARTQQPMIVIPGPPDRVFRLLGFQQAFTNSLNAWWPIYPQNGKNHVCQFSRLGLLKSKTVQVPGRGSRGASDLYGRVPSWLQNQSVTRTRPRTRPWHTAVNMVNYPYVFFKKNRNDGEMRGQHLSVWPRPAVGGNWCTRMVQLNPATSYPVIPGPSVCLLPSAGWDGLIPKCMREDGEYGYALSHFIVLLPWIHKKYFYQYETL